jgi:hypothetical protein
MLKHLQLIAIGIMSGLLLAIFILIKPLKEAHELELKEKDSICESKIKFRDSVEEVRVRKILGK